MECGSFMHKSCSSIRQSEVPQSSTDANGIILKINFAIAEDMHKIIVIVPAKRPPEKNDQLLWEGHDGILEHMPFFCRCSAHAVWRLLANDDRHVRWRR